MNEHWSAEALGLVGMLGLVVGLTGCFGFGAADPPSTLDAVPDRPNFEEHILPIMNLYCNDCHADPALQGAPDTFRLDRCEETNKAGAKKFAGRIVVRSVRSVDSPSQPMPPSSYVRPNLASIEGATLRRWLEIGAPCTPAEAATSQAGERVHPDDWSDGSDDLGQKHGLAAKLNRVQIRPWKADPVFTGVQRQGVEEGVVSVRSFD